LVPEQQRVKMGGRPHGGAHYNAAMPIGTAVHARTFALCESLNYREWSGYYAVSAYESHHEHEYNAIRNASALIDVSPLFKYLVTGKDAALLVDRLITRDVAKMTVGQVFYTPWCDEHGQVIDDGTVSRLGETRFRWTAADPSLRWFRQNAHGLDVSIEDISEQVAALALQGPTSARLLRAVAQADIDRLKYFRVTSGTIAGVKVDISRTGYTGDLGYEIWIPAERAPAVWDALMDGGRPFDIKPAGMLALDVARIEAGLMLIDVDYVPAKKALIESQTSSPYELDLAWAVNLDKEQFVGKPALATEKVRGPAWQFVGIEIGYPGLERLYDDAGLATRLPQAAWRTSVPIYSGAEQAGYATSGGWSPILKKYIALAHLRSRWARPGTEIDIEITVEHRRKRAAARVVKKPFFDPERKKS